MEFLVLEVDGAQYGVPTTDVSEVLRAVSLGSSPARFSNMAGMLNYRGQVLGVLELGCLHGWTHRELTPQDHLIILQTSGNLFGLRVDRAVEIMTWANDGEQSPENEPADDRLNAIADPRLGVVYILDPATLWSEMHFERRDPKGDHEPTLEVEAKI